MIHYNKVYNFKNFHRVITIFLLTFYIISRIEKPLWIVKEGYVSQEVHLHLFQMVGML